jgi:hypothetical protein
MSDWRDTLTAAFEEALDLLGEDSEAAAQVVEELGSDGGASEPPDLYSFYEALAVLRNEHRAGNRKTAEALSQLSETLQVFDRQLTGLRSERQRGREQDTALPRGYLLALLDLGDRARRLSAALAEPPPVPLLGAGKWPAAWANIAGAVGIFSTHVSALVDKAGVERIATEGRPFDPERMNAVATVPPTATCAAGTVARETSPGYLLAGDVLRLAEVEIAG